MAGDVPACSGLLLMMMIRNHGLPHMAVMRHPVHALGESQRKLLWQESTGWMCGLHRVCKEPSASACIPRCPSWLHKGNTIVQIIVLVSSLGWGLCAYPVVALRLNGGKGQLQACRVNRPASGVR